MFVPDHLDEGVGPIAAIATAAALTTTLKIGPLVLDCDFSTSRGARPRAGDD
jgi:hypothetical protein